MRTLFNLGKGPTEGLDDTSTTAEAKYFVNISKSRKTICLNLNCNISSKFCVLME